MMDITPSAIAQVILMGREMGRAEAELRPFIDRLGEQEQAELAAVFWVGRGSFEPEDFDEAVETAKAEATIPTADYLFGSPHFSDHLEAGAEAMGIDILNDEGDLL
ncbi:DUF3775 domain-containing protein [Gymnodinialimonas sp. 2305UL16-5]|uniref:DUF3775 domain-containing protein n=1 Tax=Gymnodinialimonas mytili TaxID=3126503 RepID=UPI0030AACFEA